MGYIETAFYILLHVEEDYFSPPGYGGFNEW
jgi:hypothetical protein